MQKVGADKAGIKPFIKFSGAHVKELEALLAKSVV